MNTELKRDLIQKAREEIYSYATNDLTCQLAEEVMSIGLAKMKLFLSTVESDSNDVLVIFGPDGSITRNKTRFSQGVGYGCVVVTKDYIFPSLLHPNGCGFGLYHVEDMPSLSILMDRLTDLKHNGVPVGNQKGKWDVWSSNHFIDLLRLEESHISQTKFKKYLPEGDYVLIHSSQQTEKQMLSYWKKDQFTRVDTPFGVVEGLIDESRDEYLDYFLKVEKYSKTKRNSIAEKLFGEANITCISNPTHQGYYKENDYFSMRLGLYNTLDSTGDDKLPLFPIGFNAYSFIYLYEGYPNIKPEYWVDHKSNQTEENKLSNILEKINILPHGGGYKLMYPFSKAETLVHKDEIYYKLFDSPIKNHMIIENIDALEYGYRNSNDILPLIEKLELGKQTAKFKPTQVIKY